MKALKNYFELAKKIYTFCKDIPLIRLMKLARILACLLFVFVWFSAHVVNLYQVILPPATLQQLQQLVFSASCRALLHGFFKFVPKLLLILFIVKVLASKIPRYIPWEVMQTVYERAELGLTIYFGMYVINSNLEFVAALRFPDTRVFFVSLLYLLTCITTQMYYDNKHIIKEIVEYTSRKSTGYVDDTGREIYEDDTVLVHSQLYTVVRLLPDKKYYLCRVGTGIITTPRNHCTNTYQDVIALEDVFAAKIPIRIYDKDKKMPEK